MTAASVTSLLLLIPRLHSHVPSTPTFVRSTPHSLLLSTAHITCSSVLLKPTTHNTHSTHLVLLLVVHGSSSWGISPTVSLLLHHWLSPRAHMHHRHVSVRKVLPCWLSTSRIHHNRRHPIHTIHHPSIKLNGHASSLYAHRHRHAHVPHSHGLPVWWVHSVTLVSRWLSTHKLHTRREALRVHVHLVRIVIWRRHIMHRWHIGWGYHHMWARATMNFILVHRHSHLGRHRHAVWDILSVLWWDELLHWWDGGC
mmetsp:Transcript_106582/g.208982  ORF Transcript_106582/g.208982 Transcript_106582/m.208982 type:complete len:254 (+) Transcript_106582:273-1034(+)